MLTSKNSAKTKQYCYFHAEFLEEIWYVPVHLQFSWALHNNANAGYVWGVCALLSSSLQRHACPPPPPPHGLMIHVYREVVVIKGLCPLMLLCISLCYPHKYPVPVLFLLPVERDDCICRKSKYIPRYTIMLTYTILLQNFQLYT